MKTLGDLVEKNRKKAFDKKRKDMIAMSLGMFVMATLPFIRSFLRMNSSVQWPWETDQDIFLEKVMHGLQVYEAVVLMITFLYIHFNVRKSRILDKRNFIALKIGSCLVALKAVGVLLFIRMTAEHLVRQGFLRETLMADFRMTAVYAFFLWFIAKFMEYGIQLREEQDPIV